MATVDQRLTRIEARIPATSPVDDDVVNIDMSDQHVAAVWRALRLVGVAEQFLPEGETLATLDAYLDDDCQSGTDS